MDFSDVARNRKVLAAVSAIVVVLLLVQAYFAGIVVLLILSWLVPSLFLIAGGQPVTENGITRTNPRRIMGFYLLIGPVIETAIFLGWLFYLVPHSVFSLIGVVLPLLVLIISGFIYAKKHKIKMALVPLVCISSLFIVLVVFFMFGGGFGPTSDFKPAPP